MWLCIWRQRLFKVTKVIKTLLGWMMTHWSLFPSQKGSSHSHTRTGHVKTPRRQPPPTHGENSQSNQPCQPLASDFQLPELWQHCYLLFKPHSLQYCYDSLSRLTYSLKGNFWDPAREEAPVSVPVKGGGWCHQRLRSPGQGTLPGLWGKREREGRASFKSCF